MSVDVNDPQMDEWAALWAEPAADDDRASLQVLASKVSRRARWLDLADAGLGAVIGLAAIIAMLLRPAPVTIAVGLVAAAGLLWYSWNRLLLKRRLRALVQVTDRVQLLDGRTSRLRSEYHLAVLGLFAAPPAILIFALLTHSVQTGSSAGFASMLFQALTEVPVGPAIIAAIATLLFQQARSARALKRELQRVEALSGVYRDERRLDGVALS